MLNFESLTYMCGVEVGSIMAATRMAKGKNGRDNLMSEKSEKIK